MERPANLLPCPVRVESSWLHNLLLPQPPGRLSKHQRPHTTETHGASLVHASEATGPLLPPRHPAPPPLREVPQPPSPRVPRPGQCCTGQPGSTRGRQQPWDPAGISERSAPPHCPVMGQCPQILKNRSYGPRGPDGGGTRMCGRRHTTPWHILPVPAHPRFRHCSH